MNTTYHLSSDALHAFNRWHLLLALLLAVLLFVLPFFGIGPNSWKTCLPAAAPAAAVAPAAPVAVPAAVPTPAPAPAVTVPPAAKVYFAVDTWDLPADVAATLGDVVAYLKGHPDTKALISGFHDPRGSVARNEELALNRAKAVRSALEAAGIARERVTMNKPQVTTGTGSNDEARRVEVSVQP